MMPALLTLQSAHQIYFFGSVAIAMIRMLRFLELLFVSKSAPCKNTNHETKRQSAHVIYQTSYSYLRNQKAADSSAYIMLQ